MWILSSSLGGKSYVDIYIYITLLYPALFIKL